MGILEDSLKSLELSVENILSLVDDYSIYTHYIEQELELGDTYSSPLRDDDSSPSFSLFYSYGKNKVDKIYFKDHALGSGDVFDFVSLLFRDSSGRLPFNKVLEQVNKDLNLGLGSGKYVQNCTKRIRTRPIEKERKKIFIVSKKVESSRFLDYWKSLGISKRIRDMYFCTEPSTVIYKGKNSMDYTYPSGLTIAYRIYAEYKLYKPFAPKKDKFRNNYPPEFVEGWLQIDWSRTDYICITKAMKECMYFREHWDIQAIAGKSESNMIPDFLMAKILKHFDKVYIWLDPDATGILYTSRYLELYPTLIPCHMPEDAIDKDITDFHLHNPFNLTDQLVKTNFNL